jgi:peroxiredoxin Q/BCP
VGEEGRPAPDFELQNDTGESGRLSDLRGGPSCSTSIRATTRRAAQACGIRDAWDDFREPGAHVLGVSPDSAASCEQFKRKHRLPFMLPIPITGWPSSTASGAEVDPGQKYKAMERSTVVVAPDGTVARFFRRVKPSQHADLVLEGLAA